MLSRNYWLQPVVDIPTICHAFQVTYAVLSPGSRCAPLVLAFSRNALIPTFSVNDERSAGYQALGMAQATGRPVVLICTSGTAASNYTPAVTEAFYLQVPLLVFTADRPSEWIDQQDGQAIRQRDMYGKHVKASYQMPDDLSHPDAQWFLRRTVSQALQEATAFPQGPVHINFPFREPFYPQADEQIVPSLSPGIIREWPGELNLSDKQWEDLSQVFDASAKVLVVAGQTTPAEAAAISPYLENLGVPVVTDTISNLQHVGTAIRHQDLFLSKGVLDPKPLQPDLLITFGKSILSKSLKIFLRQNPPKHHWHIQSFGVAADPFRSLTGTLRMSPEGFFRAATQRGWQKPHEYLLHWQKIDRKTSTGIQQFFENPMPFNEFQAVQTLFRFLKPGAVIHAANSMPVRYLNFLSPQGFQVFANRGTSGIDGSTSTAVGHALANPTQLHILLTGDVAFFYDRNGLWRANLPENLWIVVFNNAGGGIFNMIDGPSALPELSPFFIGQQPFTAETTAREAGFTYQSVHNEGELHETLSRLSTTLPNKKLLEVFTNHEDNKTVFLHFKKSIVQLFQRETKTKTS